MARLKLTFVTLCAISFCLCEIDLQKKGKLVRGFVDFYNLLPNEAYKCDEGFLLSAQKTDISNAYDIEVSLKVTETHNLDIIKFIKCSATIADLSVGVAVMKHHCQEDPNHAGYPGNIEEEVDPEAVTEPYVAAEPEFVRKPVQLDNEIQTNTAAVTSGEQFIAIPREEPKVQCIGCSSRVNPQARGVTELAELGVRQLNSLEPAVQHSLASVVEVERQVQVVNGVRYILTLLVNYNSCTDQQQTEACVESKACKVTVLEKPWMQLPSGSKYRAILSNNCTQQWQFGDDGVVPPTDNNENNNINPSEPESDIKVIHNIDVQSQAKTDKSLTEQDIKHIEEQIIPNKQENLKPVVVQHESQTFDTSKEHAVRVEPDTQYGPNSIQTEKPQKVGTLDDDKKKTIDELLNYFEMSGFNSNKDPEQVAIRMKRSYENDLNAINVAERFQKLKKSIENAKQIYILAQAVVDYLNDIDLEIKNRVLKDVNNADREAEKDRTFYYIQFHTIVPCKSRYCKKKDTMTKLCNAVVDNTENVPQVLTVFCHDEEKNNHVGEVRNVAVDDPLLQKLIFEAIKKIESESKSSKAMKLSKVVSANTQRVSGTVTKVSIMLDQTDCDKSVPLVLRSNCSVVEEYGSQICGVIIHERHWLKEKSISYTCTERPIDIRFSHGRKDALSKSSNDPFILDMVQEAMRNLEQKTKRSNKAIVIKVNSVSTKLVAGFLTNIEFVIGYTTCPNDVNIDQAMSCKLLENEPLKTCFAKVWDRSWIEDGRKIEVLCNDPIINAIESANSSSLLSQSSVESVSNQGTKRMTRNVNIVVGGEEKKDINDSKYKKIAEESLQKFLQSNANLEEHKVVSVDYVSTQVVSGSLTEIRFKIAPVKQNSGDTINCISKVWEKPWENFKDIQVTCELNDGKVRQKRQLPGGKTEKNPNDPTYKKLAEESLQKFLQSNANVEEHKVVSVDYVLEQIVAGSLTEIRFKISPVKQNSGDTINCISKVWVKPWKKFKDIQVTCELNDGKVRQKRQLSGGKTEKNPNDPTYKKLAEESLQKFLQSNANVEEHKVVSVDYVLEQIVAGSLTEIRFKISPVKQNSGDTINCISKVWVKPWEKFKDIQVTCELNDGKVRQKRQSPGGKTEKNPNDPTYKKLAEESLQKFLQSNANVEEHKVVSVDYVLEQIVAGSLTEIRFKISPVKQNSGDTINCISKVWVKPWEKFKDIQVTCELNDGKVRQKRQSPGGKTEKNPNDPTYKKLAEESLQKFLQSNANVEEHKVVSVDYVLEQIVAGSLTEIRFKISPVKQNSGDTINCISKVWVKPWEKFKDIQVTCELNDGKVRQKRQSPGGKTEKNPNDPTYKKLAEESLQKFLQSNANVEEHKVVSVDYVLEQIVAGSLTEIRFKISPVKQNSGDTINCISKVWVKPWEKFKDIQVTCELNDGIVRIKRNQPEPKLGGASPDENINDPRYKKLAEESLQEYLQSNGLNLPPHKVVSIQNVTVQVVAGTNTVIHFTISPVTQNTGDTIACKSEIWEKSWINFKNIKVDCKLNDAQALYERGIQKSEQHDNELNRNKRNIITGGMIEQDPKKSQYRKLAEISLRKYLKESDISEPHKVLTVEKALTQVVSGIRTIIVFKITPQSHKDVINCVSDIWDQSWEHAMNITVRCELDAQRVKRHIGGLGGSHAEDPTKEEYRTLARDALKKYQKKHKNTKNYVLIEVKSVTVKVVRGINYIIEFSAAHKSCARDISTCTKNPILSCRSVINQQPWLLVYDIDVACKNTINREKRATNLVEAENDHKFEELTELEIVDVDERGRRQAGIEDDDVDEDKGFYYADRAIQQLNDQVRSNNLYKLITIHAVQSSMHMENTPMVRIYLEAAETYCLRHHHDDVKLNECEELDANNHRLCLARIWPSPDDEMVIQSVAIVCDDDEKFEGVTGLSLQMLLRASIRAIEDSSEMRYKLVHQGEPQLIPSLDYSMPNKLNFIIRTTNCSKDLDNINNKNCFVDVSKPSRACSSFIWLVPNSRSIDRIRAGCRQTEFRSRRSIPLSAENATIDDIEIQNMVKEALQKLEMSSADRYKQKVIKINRYRTKVTTGKITTIDFDVAFTSCLKFEWVDDLSTCKLMEHLPRRHCVAEVWERLWLAHGRKVEVSCQDEVAPLETHVEFQSAATAMALAERALKYIEAKYPHPRKAKVLRIYSMDKQVVAGVHYRMKMEVSLTNCSALSGDGEYCVFDRNAGGTNKFCRVNVWMRPWTDHPPSFRVTCDYQDDAVADVYHQVQAEYLFRDFLATYSPDYVNDYDQLTKRFQIFKANIQKIHELNTRERGTATYGVTRFADMTYEEFTKKHTGLKTSLRDENQVPTRRAQVPDVEVPDAFDWRERGAVTEVKNQGSCGSCWAFSVTGNIEGQYQIKTGKLVSLSEQELVDCDKTDNGCNGGYMDNAYRAIEQLGGLELETDYPYEGEDDKCAFNKTMARVQISSAVNITSNETDMTKWLVQNGPISIGINANAMQFYMGGVSHPWKMLCNPGNLDHGVLIVGYGIKDYPLFHKRLPYWIVKNSWGPTWGEKGYYRVYRGDGTCGVNKMASSAVI